MYQLLTVRIEDEWLVGGAENLEVVWRSQIRDMPIVRMIVEAKENVSFPRNVVLTINQAHIRRIGPGESMSQAADAIQENLHRIKRADRRPEIPFFDIGNNQLAAILDLPPIIESWKPPCVSFSD